MLFSVQISEDENYEVLTPQSMREKIRLNKERAHARMLSAIHAHRAHDDDLEAELQNHSQVISQVWGHAGKLEVMRLLRVLVAVSPLCCGSSRDSSVLADSCRLCHIFHKLFSPDNQYFTIEKYKKSITQ